MQFTQVDSLCGEFEERWKIGDVPRLNEYIARLDASSQQVGVKHLIGIDRHYRTVHQLPQDSEFYLRHVEELDESVRELVSGLVCQETVDTPPQLNETVDVEESLDATATTFASRKLQAKTETTIVGDFEILDVIAKGGMGVVYRARDRKLDRVVALKMILSGDSASNEQVRRFHEESRAVAALEHPGIVPVHSFGTIDDQPYFCDGIRRRSESECQTP